MKKFLSLALALVMTMSLVTISASATFADDDAIAYNDAVEVMAAVDVIGGYADGSFAPTGTLTRGAAAKIICNMILGPTTAGALGADTAPFPDVPADHTFAGYIAYCAQQGILSGYADGNFYPAGNVTAYQFMKMLLGALGYSSEIEGFTGANWSINVAKLALSLGLDDGNEEFVGTAAMTREEACLYAFNTMQATMVEYPNNTTLVVGDIAITTSSKASAMENNAKYETMWADDEMQFAEKYFSNLSVSGGQNDFGQPTTTWKLKTDKIGTFINNDELVISYEGKVTNATLQDLIADDDYVVVYVDGDDAAYEKGYDLYTKNSSSAAVGSGAGSVTYVYEDGYDNYTIVTKNTYLVKAADDYNEKNEILKIDELDGISYSTGKLANYIDNDDVNVEDFAEGDYILVTIANDEIKSVALAETVTGTVTTYTNKSSVTVGGEKYGYSSKFTKTSEPFAIDEDTVVVLDAQGNIITIDDLIVNSDRYVFIDAFDYSSNFSNYTYYAAAYFSDGTYAEIQLDEILGTAASKVLSKDTVDATTTGYDATWYTYTTNSDGSYDLTEVEDKYFDDSDNKTFTDLRFYANDVAISNGSVTFAKDGTKINSSADDSIKGDSDTVFVIVDEDDDVYTFTGIKNVPDVITGAGQNAYVYALNNGTYADLVFVDARDAEVDGASASAADYMFVLKMVKVTTDSNGDKVYDYEALVDGEIIEISVTDEVDDHNDMTGKLYYDVTEDAAGYIDGAKLFSGKYGAMDENKDAYYYSVRNAVAGQKSDVFSIDKITDMDFYMHDDSVAYMIVDAGVDELLHDDGADYEVYDYTSAKSLYTDLKDYTFDATVSMISDGDGSETVVAMYVFVTDAVEDGTTSGGSTPSLSADVDVFTELSERDLENGTTAIEYYVEDGSDIAVSDIKAILLDAGASSVSALTVKTAYVSTTGVTVFTATYVVDGTAYTYDITATQMYAVSVDGKVGYYEIDDKVLVKDANDTYAGTGYVISEIDAEKDSYDYKENDSSTGYVTYAAYTSGGDSEYTVTAADMFIFTGYTELDADIDWNDYNDGNSDGTSDDVSVKFYVHDDLYGDQEVAVRANGVAGGIENFNYAAAYQAAGITLKGNTITVDKSDFAAFKTDAEVADSVEEAMLAAISNSGTVYFCVEYIAPNGTDYVTWDGGVVYPMGNQAGLAMYNGNKLGYYAITDSNAVLKAATTDLDGSCDVLAWMSQGEAFGDSSNIVDVLAVNTAVLELVLVD